MSTVSDGMQLRLCLVTFSILSYVVVMSGCGGESDRGDNTSTGNGGSEQVLFVANGGNNTTAFVLNNDGSLTMVAGSPFAVGGASVIAHPNGRFLFSVGGISTNNNGVNTDRIENGGSLTVASDITDSTFTGGLSINPAGTALYVSSFDAAEGNNGWKVYSIRSDGSLQFVGGVISQVTQPLVFSSDGSNAYMADCYHLGANIDHFIAASNGTLTRTEEQIAQVGSELECPQAVALTPTGSMLAAVWISESDSPMNLITLYNISSSTHALTLVRSPFPASGKGVATVFDSSGRFFVVAQNNGIGVYQVSKSSVTEVAGSPFANGTNIRKVMFSPSGNLVTGISEQSQQILVFAFDKSTGSLTMAPGSPVTTSTPSDLAIISH
jgi:6-phosphogluconolactonase (cycloisomerase 2 family)